jgi:hypothetical protein
MEINRAAIHETTVLKKSSVFKNLMYKAEHRPRFHSRGIDNTLKDDPVFTALSIYSLFGTYSYHISSQRRKRLPCTSFRITKI